MAAIRDKTLYMLYSIQNLYANKVYGVWPTPTGSGLSPEQWTDRLSHELLDEAPVKGIRFSPLATSHGFEPRIIVDITPSIMDETSTLENVHIAVGVVSLLASIG